MTDRLDKIKRRTACLIDMDGVRPAAAAESAEYIFDRSERDWMIAEIERLRAVLKPFAKLADSYDTPKGYSSTPDHAPIDPTDDAHHRGAPRLTIGMLRNARAVLGLEQRPDDEK